MRNYSFMLLVCLISVVCSRFALGADFIDARFDNLTTSLGLNDNFDDGVIDPAIWSIEQARVGYGIWKLSRCDPPPFIAASEQGGELRISGYTCEYFDYSRVLVSRQTFSGPFTLEVELTSLSGSGTQWGAGIAVVKDDFSAIQFLQAVSHGAGEWEPANYDFGLIASHSCISGTPGCPESPGGDWMTRIDYGQPKAPGPLTFPITLRVVYDGGTEFRVYWNMAGVEYQYTHNAPEIYGTYRIVLHGGARLGDGSGTVCGNGFCEAGENSCNCPVDCGPTSCGDGCCGGSETCSSCSSDCGPCGPICGNGSCEAGENCCTCPTDCPGVCGDGVCIPTLSEWGVVAMAALMLAAGAVVVSRRRAVG